MRVLELLAETDKSKSALDISGKTWLSLKATLPMEFSTLLSSPVDPLEIKRTCSNDHIILV